MLELVNEQAVKHGKEFAKYEINSDSLFTAATSQQAHRSGYPYGGRQPRARKAGFGFGGGAFGANNFQSDAAATVV